MYLLSISAGTACVFNMTTLNCVCRLQGHEGEVSRVGGTPPSPPDLPHVTP